MAEVVTGEAVVLEVPCARFPSRVLALIIDLVIQLVLIGILLGIVGASAGGSGLDAAAVSALLITVLVLVLVGYPITWETATRGRSPGKFALGLRVVGDDGSPERFRQALVRGLATVVDFWFPPFFGVPALVCSLLSDRGKRLGDVFAGTFVIQQRLPARRGAAAQPPAMPPELAAWACGLELSGLTDATAAMARRYLARLAELTPAARAELGERIAATVRGQVGPPPPPGTPAPDYLGAVLAERHRRDRARLMPPGWSPVPAPTPAPAQAPAPAPVLVPGTAWTGAAWEGEGARLGLPGEPSEPGASAGQPARGTGFVPPQ